MEEQTALQLPADTDGEVRRFVDATWPRNPLREPRVQYWRIAGRTTLLTLLGFSGLQYYFFDVYLTIMAMSRVTLVAGLQ